MISECNFLILYFKLPNWRLKHGMGLPFSRLRGRKVVTKGPTPTQYLKEPDFEAIMNVGRATFIKPQDFHKTA